MGKSLKFFRDWRDVPQWAWDICPNFHPETDRMLVSPDNGSIQFHIPSFYSLQAMREIVAGPIRVNSGYRTELYNATLRGSSPTSFHYRLIAFDLSTRGQDRLSMKDAALEAGFTGIGMYETFIHVDRGRRREWYSSEWAKELWNYDH